MAIETPNREGSVVGILEEPRDTTMSGLPPELPRMALFPEADIVAFRQRWHDLQSNFVDEPRFAVEQANELVGTVVNRLTQLFSDERNKLTADWGKGNDVSTEDLRQALHRYRSFFDRLLSA